MKQQELVEKVKESIRKLDPRARVILFGSWARGDSKTNSDWDFLIISSLQVNELQLLLFSNCFVGQR